MEKLPFAYDMKKKKSKIFLNVIPIQIPQARNFKQ